MTQWYQKIITLTPRPKGCYLITSEIIQQTPEISQFQVGLIHLFLMHTSAALSINENADPDVRRDLNYSLDRLIPFDSGFHHVLEGQDDMPAHIKTSVIGTSLLIPIRQGRLLLGTWQGIYLCEFRHQGDPRQLTVTIFGETKS